MAAKLPRRQRSPLIARARLVGKDVYRQPFVVGHVDGRRRRAPIDGSKPAGIAVGEDVDALARLFARGDVLDQGQAVPPDGDIDGDILVADLRRAGIGRRNALGTRAVADRGDHLVERPFQIDRGRPRRQ